MVILYMAQKDNVNFYIQPDQIETYDNLGYEIIKLQPTTVKNVAAEFESINNEGSSNIIKTI